MNWLEEEAPIDWSDVRAAHRRTRELLSRLAADKGLLSELVHSLPDDPVRFGLSEVHPLMNRFILHHNDAQRMQIRMHISPGANDVLPHDHKYTFTAYVLAGGYIHVWRRRLGEQQGDFAGTDLRPGIVAVETPGSCYTFSWSLVHQTVMAPNTVSLFMRGPKSQDRSHAATDMLHIAEQWGTPDDASKPKHANGQRAVQHDEYLTMREQLVQQGLIDQAVAVRAAL